MMKRVSLPQSFSLRNPGTLYGLRHVRMTVVAPANDRAWQGTKNRVNKAYDVVDRLTRIIPDWTIAYQPKHPGDWETHPEALRALDMIGFVCISARGPIDVDYFRLNSMFFQVDKEAARAIVTGEKTESDLLDLLERRRSGG